MRAELTRVCSINTVDEGAAESGGHVVSENARHE